MVLEVGLKEEDMERRLGNVVRRRQQVGGGIENGEEEAIVKRTKL